MIIGNLKTIEQEMNFYPAAIQQGLQFLLTNDLAALENGTYPIDENKIFAKVASYETEPIEKRRPERHEKYIDIQYIAKGREQIGTGSIADAGEVDTDKLAAGDILYYQGMRQGEWFVTLTGGIFAIYFPWDVHRPNCQAADIAEQVKKIVVKVAMNTL